MAIEYARAEYLSRLDGDNACRSAAYNARSDVRCQRTGERFYFAHRDPVLHHEILLPEGADERFRDTTTLWNEAQKMERRKDSQEAREVLLALPSNPELGLEDWKTMCREFIAEHFVGKGLAAQIDIHDAHPAKPGEAPDKGNINQNIHAHVLITTRRIERDRFAKTKARDLDPEVRTLKGGRRTVTEGERWGALWRDYQNLYFERHGLELRVDETGFVGQTHEGPVRMRTVPTQSDERLAETREANEAAARDPVQVLAKLTEKRATFAPLDIERLLRKHIHNSAERRAIRDAVLARPEVIALHDRETGYFAGRYTTHEVRGEEQEVLAAAQRIADTRTPVKRRHARRVAKERGLDREQQIAFQKATGTEGLVVIEGLAGAGKSHSLTAIREAHERSGWRVVGLAFMNVVADDLRRSGFHYASTAHREVWWQEKIAAEGGRTGGGRSNIPRWDRKTLIIVEEAAMLDTHVTARLMRQAAESGAKVVLAGDDRQLASVERGGMFTAIKQHHGSVVISKVRRQQENWQRAASEDFANRRIKEGLRAYAERGHVHWSKTLDESRARLLSDWDQDSREKPKINRFVYASTNAEVNQINRAIHDIRVRRKEVAGELEVETVKGKIAIGTGERIQFHGNDRDKGIYNGSLGTIDRIKGHTVTLTTDTGREIVFDAREFREFGYGYAGTVYRGQGKTQTDVYALYDNSFAWNARTAYVGLTRHKNNVELYVSRDLARDEIALGEQMQRQTHDEASLTYATQAEIIELQKEREGRGKGSSGRGTAGRGDGGSVSAYDKGMADPNKRRRAAEAKARTEIAPDDPDRAAKEAAAKDRRDRDVAGAEYEDRLEIAGETETQRVAFAKAEAERIDRLNREAGQARDTGQRQLKRVGQEQPRGHETWLEEQKDQVADARLKPGRLKTGAKREQEAPTVEKSGTGIPMSAQLRYTEALAQHYDPRDPYGSLAKASLTEAAAYMRDRHALDQRIAGERNPGLREALMLRRDIEHADHMAQTYGRIAGLARATGAREAAQYQDRAQGHRQDAQKARQLWRERGLEQPELYAELTPERERQPEQVKEAPAKEQESRPQVQLRTPEQERVAMKRLDLPAYAAERHGYKLEWRDDEHTRAKLTRGIEVLQVSQAGDGTWSYDSRLNIKDRGDIVDFEVRRGARTLNAALEKVRPELERVEQERGRLDLLKQPERDRGRERDEGFERERPEPGERGHGGRSRDDDFDRER